MMIKKIFSAVVFLGILSTLLMLGTWQLQRLAWKNNIIQQLEREYSKNPNQNIYSLKTLSPPETSLSLLYGSIRGRFIYEKEILVGPKPLEGNIGYLVITPMELESGGYVLVNRGWIDELKRDRLKNTRHRGFITVSGVFRQPDWNRFIPNNSPENNVWSKLDIAQISAVKKISPVSPLMLYAEKSSKNFSELIPQEEKWFPRNKHKQYAIFWFGMAVVFSEIFALAFFRTQPKS